MSTVTDKFAPPGSSPDEIQSKDSPPVVWLARLGFLFLLLNVYVFGRWIFSDAFVATPPGPDDGGKTAWIYFWDGLSIAGSIVFVTWIVRKTMREKQLPAVAIVAMAWMLTAWQDPLVNALRPVFAYNAHFFNRGSWGEFIPGWVDSGGVNPQPLFWWIGIYLFFVPANMLGAAAYVNWWRRRFPRLNRAALIAILMVLMFAQDVFGEWLTLIQGVDRYLLVPEGFALWPGTNIQFPLYEGLVWGCGMVGLSAVIFCFRDAQDRMMTDRGLDRVAWKGGHTFVRVLALGAVFNIAMMVFFLGFNFINQHAETRTPDSPSYFSNTMCGVGENPPCK